jgi:hypothetical protein
MARSCGSWIGGVVDRGGDFPEPKRTKAIGRGSVARSIAGGVERTIGAYGFGIRNLL